MLWENEKEVEDKKNIVVKERRGVGVGGGRKTVGV